MLSCFIFTLFLASCSTSKYGDRSERYSRARVKSKSDRVYKPESKEPVVVKANQKADTKIPDKAMATEAGKKSSDMMMRADMVQSSFKLIGTPYKSTGKTPEEGFDCSGFTNYVYNQNGYKVSGPSGKLAEMGVYRSQSQLKPGDLVFFGKDTQVTHVGMVTNNTKDQTYFIHASTSMGVKIDEINGSDYWRPKFLFGRDILFDLTSDKPGELKASSND